MSIVLNLLHLKNKPLQILIVKQLFLCFISETGILMYEEESNSSVLQLHVAL